MAHVYFESVPMSPTPVDGLDSLKRRASRAFLVPPERLYVTVNGKIARDDSALGGDGVIRVCVRLVGGKGGFGSMLRAIGAQIEKTTNREACRDLSGRRLRDINEEQRLRKWLEGQTEREREAAERRHKKLERLCAEPAVSADIDDATYETERRELPERVSAAVEAGWGASTAGGKRRAERDDNKKKKKKKLWLDEDLSSCSSSDEDGVESAPGGVQKPGNDERTGSAERAKSVERTGPQSTEPRKEVVM